MEGLLKWSIAAQSGDTTAKPDPKALSELFGAPDEITQMKAELTIAKDSTDKDDRLEYLEKFEEHVENVDNANNIGDMWPVLVDLTTDKDNDIKATALSCIGYAVQNNEKSQADFLKVDQGIERVMKSVNDENDTVAVKALFALSCSIAHCQSAYERFRKNNGWQVLSNLLLSKTDSVKRNARVLSLLYSIALLLPNNEIYDQFDELNIKQKLEANLKETGIISEKSQDILTILKENPRAPVKLLN